MVSIREAAEMMQSAALAGKEKLEGNGFIISTETDYLNARYQSVSETKKAKFITVALVIAKEDGKEGEEYCMSIGAAIERGGVNEKRLGEDLAAFDKMVNEALAILDRYENKNEGHDFLTAKANEEYELLVKKIEEEQKKSRKVALIGNVVFILGIALLFIIAFLR